MSSTLLDIIGSFFLFGIMMLTVARVQSNLNEAVYENSFSIITQRNATDLARQIEFDFTKIGYKAGTVKVLSADTNKIRFRSVILDNGVMDTVQYTLGTVSEASATLNPNDFPLKRRDRLGEIVQLYGLTELRFRFYDNKNSQITTPITHIDSLKKIYSIDVAFTVEGREPGAAGDTTYYAVSWRKLIYPRNLSY